MKIVQVTPRYPPQIGGVETHVKEISERLVERGHEVIVLTADASHGRNSGENRSGPVVHRYRGLSPTGAFHAAPGIVRALSRLNPDVVHAHNYHSLPLLFAAFTARGMRFIVTPHYHGASPNAVRNRLLSVYRPLGGWALRQADAAIAVSEWERDQLRSDFGINTITIPNGLDIEMFQDAEQECRERPYLLCVGRLEKYKGVQHVVKALPELPEYELVIAGTGPYRDQLERCARDVGVGGRTTFLGYADEQRLRSLYAGAEVYVNLSEFEAYGMTVAEALAAGTPCVVRNANALSRWSMRSDCVGVRSIEPRIIARAVRKAVDLPIRSEPAPAWDEVVTRTIAVYRN